MALHPHAPAAVQHLVPRQMLVHADATQEPPEPEEPDDPEDPDELEHVPPLHVPPLSVQSTHAPPPVPHVESPLWHVFDESQQPVGHEVESQVGVPLLPPPSPAASDEPAPKPPLEPPSSPPKKKGSGPPLAHAAPSSPATGRTMAR